ncbi:putative outer membrane lipoprotein [Vibrio ponticus]|nr:putative outer membrane lipoprotein [Vibrio ponticus]
MSHKLRNLTTLSLFALLTGCAAPYTQVNQEAQDVHVRFDSGFDADQCQWLGDVTGTEGHWYSYLFFTNDAMVQGAINDVKNRAKKLGATTVYVIVPQDFTTSFTVVGNAYKCG